MRAVYYSLIVVAAIVMIYRVAGLLGYVPWPNRKDRR